MKGGPSARAPEHDWALPDEPELLDRLGEVLPGLEPGGLIERETFKRRRDW